jgi:hypothetical protein
MSTEFLVAVVGAGLAVLGMISFIAKRTSRKGLNRDYFQAKWKELQKGLNKEEAWPMAIIQADNLLDEALKKKKFKGKTMGERLVSAQKSLTDNDGAWFGHKLRNKIVHEVDIKITKKEVQKSLVGIRQALRDLGALK